MANPVHLEAAKNGPEALRTWQEQNKDVKLDLSEADLASANLRKAELTRAYLREANLRGADLTQGCLRRANLRGANLVEADLHGADLSWADLTGAKVIGANLRGANLGNSDLKGAVLGKADLTQANLSGANLWGTHLSLANMTLADLCEANLRHAYLDDVVLNGANLIDTDLTRANLSGAQLEHAACRETVFGSVDLSEVKGLDRVEHRGPSTIGVDTLYKSKGKIPEAFLRGCGVPDTMIAYLASLAGSAKAIEFNSCFISYSHKDEKFAKRLHSRMQEEHLRVWYAPEDMRGGEKIHEQIDRAIRIFDKLLLVLSENSMKSEWVTTEIRKARKVERETKRRKLFPIRLVDFETIRDWECFDADGGKDLAVEVREYLIPDFAKWKNHDAFEAAFERLLRDLRADEIKGENK
jgi:uncharacterized protein YjbI with pentapeptide repeats